MRKLLLLITAILMSGCTDMNYDVGIELVNGKPQDVANLTLDCINAYKSNLVGGHDDAEEVIRACNRFASNTLLSTRYYANSTINRLDRFCYSDTKEETHACLSARLSNNRSGD